MIPLLEKPSGPSVIQKTKTFSKRSRVRGSASFLCDERGGLTIFTLYIFLVMILVGGMAVDFMRYETARVQVQSTLDRAVLAAADREQSLNPKTVVRDYFDSAGLDGLTVNTDVKEGMNYRTVSATTTAPVRSLFLHMTGIDVLTAPAAGTADERVTNIEISLVLDVSTSMKDNSRIDNLKVAAKNFVETVLKQNGAPGSGMNLTHVSVIPFNQQTNAGPTLAGYLNFPGDHTRSYCVDWKEAQFDETAVSATTPLLQTPHFSRGSRLSTSKWFSTECRTSASREIMPFSSNVSQLKTYIENLSPGGYTSIDVGAKWGAALLDPAFRGVVNKMVTDKELHKDVKGRPFNYGETGSTKIMIVMTDGANTRQWTLKGGVRKGPSNVWYDAKRDLWSVYLPSRSGSNKYWHKDVDAWRSSPDGGDAKRLTYQELWSIAGVNWVTEELVEDMLNSETKAQAWKDTILLGIDEETKDPRTSKICTAAKKKGVVVYTIGFETGTAGDIVLEDCASSPSHFFNAEGTEISTVFATIASEITELKLTN